jgi:colicin V production protein
MGIVVDLIIVAVMLLFIFLGYKKGLTGSLIKLLSFVIAIVLAVILYKPVGNVVIENTTIDDNIRTSLNETFGVQENKQEEKNEENVPSSIMNNINKEIENATDEVKTNVIDETTKTVVYVGSAIVIFLAVKVVLLIVSLFTSQITKLPIIRQVDKIGGLAYGAIEGIVIVYAILAVISLTSVIWANNAVVMAIGKSTLGEMLYNNNIILNLLFK